MKRTLKWLRPMTMTLMVLIGLSLPAFAMHIMEGYLPLSHCIGWGIACIPFLVLGLRDIKKTIAEDRRLILILAMVGAYAFILSALKIPSVTGSSSHPTGTGLVAILFGPFAGSIVGIIVLLFQAILLAHGGLTTLGANTFSMGIVGPIVSYLIYKGSKKAGMNKKLAVFLAAMLGDLLTYVTTSIQLALAHPSQLGGAFASFVQFAGVFATTQVPLAIIEGILTVVVFMGLENLANDELGSLQMLRGI